jgi:hypothetical protein
MSAFSAQHALTTQIREFEDSTNDEKVKTCIK